MDGKQYEEYFITACKSDIISELNIPEFSHIDELNYLANILTDSQDFEAFAAAVSFGENTSSIAGLINLAENLDSYTIYSDISNEQELGEMYAKEAREAFNSMVEVLEESSIYSDKGFAKYIRNLETNIDYESYGLDCSLSEASRFTSKGYIVNCGGFQEVYNGQVPDKYKVFAFPKSEIPKRKPPPKQHKKRNQPKREAR